MPSQLTSVPQAGQRLPGITQTVCPRTKQLGHLRPGTCTYCKHASNDFRNGVTDWHSSDWQVAVEWMARTIETQVIVFLVLFVDSQGWELLDTKTAKRCVALLSIGHVGASAVVLGANECGLLER